MHFATSMAFSRQQWVEKYRNRLEGALGEYTKLLIIRHFVLNPLKMEFKMNLAALAMK